MADQNKFSPSVGGEIDIEVARKRIAAFQTKYPDAPGTFKISPSVISDALKDEKLSGLRFCLGMDQNKQFTPVIGGSNEEGYILSTFGTHRSIDRQEYNTCSELWQEHKPYNLNSVFMGRDTLALILKNFPEATLDACVDLDGDDFNMCFLVTNTGGYKDGDDDGEECAFNTTITCPNFCPPD